MGNTKQIEENGKPRLKTKTTPVATKWFDHPEQRVTNRDLMKLKSRNSDEDSLVFLFDKGITTDIDIPLLKVVRFNTDHKTKLSKIGCRIGDYELITKQGFDHVYDLKKHTSKSPPKKAIPSSAKPKAVKVSTKKLDIKPEKPKKEVKSKN